MGNEDVLRGEQGSCGFLFFMLTYACAGWLRFTRDRKIVFLCGLCLVSC